MLISMVSMLRAFSGFTNAIRDTAGDNLEREKTPVITLANPALL